MSLPHTRGRTVAPMNGTEHTGSPAEGGVPDRKAYSVPEVAQLLGGVTERYVWMLLSRDELKSVKIGGRRMVPASDLDAFIDGLRQDEQRARESAASAA